MTVSYDTDAGYGPNRVAIWHPAKHAPVHEVGRFAPGTGPIAIRWIAPARLEVLYSRTEYSSERDRNTDAFHIWRDANGEWHDSYAR